MWVVKVGLRELHVCVVNCQSPTPEDTEDDQLLVRQRLLRQQKKTEMVAESSDTATIKKLHVSSANLQRVSTTSCLTFINLPYPATAAAGSGLV